MDLPFYKSLPKLELHAHLNGSLSEKTLKELQASHESIQDFLKLNVLELGPSRTLEECFEIFKIAHSVTNNAKAVTKATEDVIAEFSEDGVIYLELRTTPRKEPGMTKEQYVNAVIEGIRNCKIGVPKIKVKLILSLDRKQDITEAKDTVSLALKYNKEYPDIVVAIDVSGDPTKGSWFKTLLTAEIRNNESNNLKLTVHCAEVPNEKEVLDILNFKPDRLGHGTCINPETGGSQILWDKLVEQKIFVECCLTSNVKTKTIKYYQSHHLKQFLITDHPFTLCTDDKGVFSTSLSQEFQIAAEVFGLTKHDLWKICLNTIEYTFCSEKEKQELKVLVKKWYQANLLQETTL